MFFNEKYILLGAILLILILFVINCTLINRTPVEPAGFNKSIQQSISKIATLNQWVIIYINFIIMVALFLWVCYEFLKTIKLTGDDADSPENKNNDIVNTDNAVLMDNVPLFSEKQ